GLTAREPRAPSGRHHRRRRPCRERAGLGSRTQRHRDVGARARALSTREGVRRLRGAAGTADPEEDGLPRGPGANEAAPDLPHVHILGMAVPLRRPDPVLWARRQPAAGPRRTVVARRAYAVAEGGLGENAVFFDESLFPGYAWVFPLADGRVNLGVGLLSETRGRVDAQIPALFEKFVEGLRRHYPR